MIRTFNYQQHWKKYRGERKEYEESFAPHPERLAAIKSATLRYELRAPLRPKHCGVFLDKLYKIIKKETDGITE